MTRTTQSDLAPILPAANWSSLSPSSFHLWVTSDFSRCNFAWAGRHVRDAARKSRQSAAYDQENPHTRESVPHHPRRRRAFISPIDVTRVANTMTRYTTAPATTTAPRAPKRISLPSA